MLGSECRAQIWARGFGQLGSEEASEGNKAYDYSIGGTAMGAEAVVAQDVSVGASFGYAKSEVEVKGDAGQTSIGSFMGSAHGRFERGGAFITGTVGGGHQDLDLLRTASVGAGAIDAEADTSGWLAGAGLMAGFRAQVDGGWTIAPTASLSYLHQWIGGYEEEVGTVSIDIEEHDTGLWRLRTEIEGRHSQIVGETHVAPYVKLGWVGEHGGGGTAAGSFSTGDEFKLAIGTREEVRALGGVGLDLSFASGFDAHLSYEGEASRTSAVHSIMGGVNFVW
jgi:outer membrane autotransporter protein